MVEWQRCRGGEVHGIVHVEFFSVVVSSTVEDPA